MIAAAISATSHHGNGLISNTSRGGFGTRCVVSSGSTLRTKTSPASGIRRSAPL